jgi:hypothetical protein
MGLLDSLLKAYLEEAQPGSNKVALVDQFVENVEKKGLKTSTNSQHANFKLKNYIERLETEATDSQDPILSISKKTFEPDKLELNIQNVEDVACVRESESANLTSSIHIRVPSAPSPVGSHARTSNILNKMPVCDSCPACGHWDGYGWWKMEPGRYCFYSAYFKGKTARPVPIAEARKACQKANETDSYEN